MKHLPASFIFALVLACAPGCHSKSDSTDVQSPTTKVEVQASSSKTALDLVDLKTNPGGYAWFDFRPNVKKLILSGAAETEHVAILWYTVDNGSVGLHSHSKTESVYVIDGTQTDAKGVYPSGTVYFNPPGSGHAIMDSSGFFILAYASPPDFAHTASIGPYTPVRIDTAAPDLTSSYPFAEQAAGVRTFDVPLDAGGGMSGKFIELTASPDDYAYVGNYLLVLTGSCDIDGATFGVQTLLVAKTVTPEPFRVRASDGSSCLAMGLSFSRI